MNDMETLKEILLSIQGSDHNECDISEQEDVCQILTHALSQLASLPEMDEGDGDHAENDRFIRTNLTGYKPTTPNTTIRSVIGNLPSVEISSFVAQLSNLIASRHDPHDLLPPTQDEAANELALTSSAVTLTRQSLLSAKVYLELVSIPGSWAAGLIDVAALSSLSALIRRWMVEMSTSSIPRDEDPGPDRKRKGTRPTNTKELKRSRKHESTLTVSDEASEDGSCSFADMTDNGLEVSTLSLLDLKMLGFEVAASVAKVIGQKELQNWSDEARESVLSSAICCITTCAATVASKNSTRKSCDVVVQSLISSLSRCVFHALGEIESPKKALQISKASDTIVGILRDLMPCLSLQQQVPNGAKGKDAAQEVLIQSLETMIETISDSKFIASCARESTATKATRRNSVQSVDGMDDESSVISYRSAATPQTGKKKRKKRISFGTINGNEMTIMSPPLLKESKTPLRSRRRQSLVVSPIRHERPRPILIAVVGLLQKFATIKGLDRAPLRNSVVSAFERVLPCLPSHERQCMVRFILQLCNSKVSVHRLVGVELVGMLQSAQWLLEQSGSPEQNNTQAISPNLELGHSLFDALAGRLQDRAPAVRARSAHLLGEVARIEKEDVRSLLLSAFRRVAPDVFATLRTRASLDDRATVRKSAIHAMTQLQLVCMSSVNDENDQAIACLSQTDVQLLGQLCAHDSVSTRKAAADSLTRLLQAHTENGGQQLAGNADLAKTWTLCVLPMVLDAEPSCVSSTVDRFTCLVLDPLIDYMPSHDGDKNDASLAWRILAIVAESCEQEGATKGEFEALKTAMRKVSETQFGDKIAPVLQTMQLAIEFSVQSSDLIAEESIGSWCMLDAVTDQPKEISGVARWGRNSGLGFLHNALNAFLRDSLKSLAALPCSLKPCLRSISRVVKCAPQTDAEKISDSLKDVLQRLQLPPSVMGNAVTAFIACAQRLKEEEDGFMDSYSEPVRDLLEVCESVISGFLSSYSKLGGDPTKEEEERLLRAVFLVGELSMVGFQADENVGTRSGKLGNASRSRPTRNLVSLVQTLLSKYVPRADDVCNDRTQTPPAVRAHAYVTLGKLCLRDEGLARECLVILARELHQNLNDSCSVVQSNALLVLGDLCVKYTNLADRYLPVMAACLQAGAVNESDNDFLLASTNDDAALVRKHAVLMLSSLLLQDYIKWRGLLFHRFLVATSDFDEGVAKLAEMTLCGPLLTKFPKIFYNGFVEALFVLNRCTAHPIFKAAASSGENGAGITVGFEGINLSGPSGPARRRQMYQIMLSHLSDEEKIGVSARLAKDVLGAAVESVGDLGRVCRHPPELRDGKALTASDESALNVLREAFDILTSPSLRVGRRQNEDDPSDADESAASRSQQVVVAKGRLLSRISRKHLIEIVLPILCNLKGILQSSCSPLLKELMRYLTEIYRSFKTEVTEFLANDPTLLQEIEYDARQFQKSQLKASTPGRERSVVVVAPS